MYDLPFTMYNLASRFTIEGQGVQNIVMREEIIQSMILTNVVIRHILRYAEASSELSYERYEKSLGVIFL